jgi:hypothetical protein
VNRFFSFVGFIALSALGTPSFGSEVSDKFQAELERACGQVDSSEVCACYAKSVTERYNDAQLLAIFNLLKNKEANRMFMITHAVEGRACKSPN